MFFGSIYCIKCIKAEAFIEDSLDIGLIGEAEDGESKFS